MGRKVEVAKDRDAVVTALRSFLELKLIPATAGSATSVITVGLSGGSLPAILAEAFEKITSGINFDRIRFMYCDERIVPFDDKESTHGVYRDVLAKRFSLPEENFVAINPTLSAEQCAIDYEKKLKMLNIPLNEKGWPRFDFLLLGLGPDGHTCSLFPGHSLLNESSKWVAPIIDSPKPPPQRITLTLPVLNSAKHVVFVSTGASKADVIQRIMEPNEEPPLPGALVNPDDGELLWILDHEAASKLKTSKC